MNYTAYVELCYVEMQLKKRAEGGWSLKMQRNELSIECLGKCFFDIPHGHFFDFGAECFFFGAEFLNSPLNGAE